MSMMKITTATQMMEKPTQRIGSMCSLVTNTAQSICMTGVRYWIMPSEVKDISWAARAKASSGRAVTTPATISRAVCPPPSVVKVDSGPSHSR